MWRRCPRALVLVTVMFAAFAVPAAAGGWAVTSFSDVPAEFQAGETYTLEYTILQHGEHPADVSGTGVRIWSEATGEERAFDGNSTSEAGVYRVDVTFPGSGTWQWEVDQGPLMAQSLGAVEVQNAAGTAATGSSTSGWMQNSLLAGSALMIALFAIQAGLLVRDRRQGVLEPATASGD